MTDRETLILDQEDTIWLAPKLFNLSVTYPHFFHSLVILAVPNGPVYELVLKGSALPKEDDKYDLTFFFLLASILHLCELFDLSKISQQMQWMNKNFLASDIWLYSSVYSGSQLLSVKVLIFSLRLLFQQFL